MTRSREGAGSGRFLPAFDNAILGYRDRSRIIDHAHLGLSVAGHRVVLVDGRVRATWTPCATSTFTSPRSGPSPPRRARPSAPKPMP